mgnify:CR=1 FL=1
MVVLRKRKGRKNVDTMRVCVCVCMCTVCASVRSVYVRARDGVGGGMADAAGRAGMACMGCSSARTCANPSLLSSYGIDGVARSVVMSSAHQTTSVRRHYMPPAVTLRTGTHATCANLSCARAWPVHARSLLAVHPGWPILIVCCMCMRPMFCCRECPPCFLDRSCCSGAHGRRRLPPVWGTCSGSMCTRSSTHVTATACITTAQLTTTTQACCTTRTG